MMMMIFSLSVCRFWGVFKTEMGDHGRTDVADDAEPGGEFVLLIFWEYGTHYVIWWAVSNVLFNTVLCVFGTYIR